MPKRFVAQGLQAKRPWDERFIERVQRKLTRQTDDINISLVQRRTRVPPLEQIERMHKDRNRAILNARYRTVQNSEIGAFQSALHDGRADCTGQQKSQNAGGGEALRQQ